MAKPTTIKIQLRELHPGQLEIKQNAKRFNTLECGRRFGKSTLGEDLIIEKPLNLKQPAGWFAPTYMFLDPIWDSVVNQLGPIITRKNEQKKSIHLATGGLIDFWSLENKDAGRGRKYARVIIDEAGMIAHLKHSWENSIRATLTDYVGDLFLLSTPKGRNFFHECFARGQDPQEKEWASWRKGSIDNPYLDKEEIAAARRELPEAVFKQEYEGIPADDGGNPFGISSIRNCIGPISNRDAVVFGVDLAKSQDYCVVVGLDSSGCVCVFERWQSDWKQTRERVAGIVGYIPCLIDSTGVGDPIVEDLQRTANNFEGFKFTSTAKQQIMEGLASAIQRSSLRIPDGVMIAELESFCFEYSKRGVRYSAPPGMHDDCVCALALAVQHGSNPSCRPFNPEEVLMGRSSVSL
jgi:hypothetical protein